MRTLALEKNEKEILVVRKSLFVFVVQTLGFLFLAFVVPLLFEFVFSSSYFFIRFEGEAAFVPSFFRAVWYLFLWVFYFLRLTDYFLDMWIVTNYRVVDVHQNGLFARNIATLSLDKIQDVTVDIRGFFPTIFGYGTISIQSAGAEKEFTMHYAASPMKAKEKIMNAYHELSTAVSEVKVVQ